MKHFFIRFVIPLIVAFLLLPILKDIAFKQYGIEVPFQYIGLSIVTGMMYQNFYNWLQE